MGLYEECKQLLIYVYVHVEYVKHYSIIVHVW